MTVNLKQNEQKNAATTDLGGRVGIVSVSGDTVHAVANNNMAEFVGTLFENWRWGLPPEGDILQVGYDGWRDRYYIGYAHPSFSVVSPGQTIPRYEGLMQKQDDGMVNVTFERTEDPVQYVFLTSIDANEPQAQPHTTRT